MAKDKNIVTIDFSKWCTQAEYARLSGRNPNTVNQWVKRARDNNGTKIAIFEIPQLELTLVQKP